MSDYLELFNNHPKMSGLSVRNSKICHCLLIGDSIMMEVPNLAIIVLIVCQHAEFPRETWFGVHSNYKYQYLGLKMLDVKLCTTFPSDDVTNGNKENCSHFLLQC